MFAAAAVVNYRVGKFAEAVPCGFFLLLESKGSNKALLLLSSLNVSFFLFFTLFPLLLCGYAAMVSAFLCSDLFLKWDWMPTFHHLW